MIAHPRTTLEYLNRRGGASWWVPLVLAVIFVVVPVLVAAPALARQAREAVVASQEEMAEQRGMELSAEQQAQVESIAASPFIIVVFPTVGSVIGLIVGWLAWAGALYLAGVALGGRSPFGSMFRTVVWAWLPYVIRGVLQTIYILATGQVITHPGLSGIAAESPVLSAFLSRIDLFLVWNLVLLIIGVGVVTHLPRRKSAIVTLGVWVLFTAVSLGFTAISLMIGRQFGALG